MHPTITPLGDHAVRVEFDRRDNEPRPEINRRVRAFCAALTEQPIDGVVECVPAFATVAVHYRPDRIAYRDLVTVLDAVERRVMAARFPAGRTIEIPVIYGGEYGPDLTDVAAAHSITEEQVIAAHTAAPYLVYMLGFVPGFPYLGGLPPQLATPRRAAPRTRVPAGSVAIGGNQTGVYPIETPGGWHIIGRSPLRLYDIERDPPALLAAGDSVRFTAIDDAEFARIAEGLRS